METVLYPDNSRPHTFLVTQQKLLVQLKVLPGYCTIKLQPRSLQNSLAGKTFTSDDNVTCKNFLLKKSSRFMRGGL